MGRLPVTDPGRTSCFDSDPPNGAGLIVRVPGLASPSFEALDDGEAPLLTPGETEVLAAIADGLSNKACAPAGHLPAHGQVSRRVAVSQARCCDPRRRRAARGCGNDYLKSEPEYPTARGRRLFAWRQPRIAVWVKAVLPERRT